jgi:uncharacterized protein YcgI (DUF1989 family)
MDQKLKSITLQPGKATAIPLQSGDELKITSPEGGQGGDFTFLGFDQSLTRNINGWEKFGNVKVAFYGDPGMKLYDGDGVPFVEVVEVHSQGRVDLVYPGCWHEIYEDGRPGCRDLLSHALGVQRKELTGMASFWVWCEVDEDGYKFGTFDIQPGDYLVLRALRPVTLGVSACPDDTLPGIRPSNLKLEVTKG